MYHVNPIITSTFHIEYPTSMYTVKPISTDHFNKCNNLNAIGSESADVSEKSSKKSNQDIVQQIDNILKTNNDMAELEARQEVILRHLKELKDRLLSMQKELKPHHKSAQSKAQQSTEIRTTQKPIDTTNLRDIVINANPSNVPYSLFALKKLWTDRLSLNIQFYIHSTVSSLTDRAKSFQDICTTHQPTATTSVNINFIWKNVNNIEMIIESLPIVGESNILRYLARIGPNEFNYESNGSNFNEIDSQLDLSELLIATPTAKDRQIILKNLNSFLGKNEYFGGKESHLNDLCLASAVRQATDEKELPPALLKWSRKVLD
ncbi:putative aminoacyl tRNA synthase complex-interacting multifunctional protein 2 [Pseudolycoriella hygida]|uniref:Aminoacyl tRNA synthase complex-interacting multifunctional protein 2 n=1 Tax=Pseudolycoriella hygida TaxID=35572 RepID=A0A9Q0NAB2_9DIPT|nr:putative aminoacyl tRNA synthase complex-interacting multifunctional protein 2 [Pseudolycoriella hygida]